MSALPWEFDPVPSQGIPALPVPVAPVVIMPASATPAVGMPVAGAPASDTPASNTAAADTPAVAAPAVAAPVPALPVPDALASDAPTPGAPHRPGVAPRWSGQRARPVGRRRHPVGVRACSAISRAEHAAAAQRPVQARPAEVTASPPLRLTPRGRAAIAACGVVVATLLWFAIATVAHAAAHSTPAHGAPAATAQPAMTRIVVEPGQTLWSIATQADPSADPRLVVQRIVAVNKLTGESVAAGQRLWVPRG